MSKPTMKMIYQFMCVLLCQIVECSDRFIVCGDEYARLREEVTKGILEKNLNTVKEAIQVYHFYFPSFLQTEHCIEKSV